MKGRNIFTFFQPQIIPMMMPGLFTLFSCQVVSNSITPDFSTTGSSVIHYLLELAQIHVHWVRYTLYFILRRPLLLLTSIFPNSSVFSNESTLSNRWPKIRASASASVLPINIQVWFPLGLTGLISLHFKGLSRVFSSMTIQNHQFLSTQPSLWTNSHIHPHMITVETIALTIQIFAGKMMSLLFNMLSRFLTAFFPMNKSLLISWL